MAGDNKQYPGMVSSQIPQCPHREGLTASQISHQFRNLGGAKHSPTELMDDSYFLGITQKSIFAPINSDILLRDKGGYGTNHPQHWATNG
jgi:hypothetical protein